MNLDQKTISELAQHLEAAELNASDVVKITDAHPNMDYEDAYAIQYEIRKNKISRGQKFAGLKMGLTSQAKMKQMGVDTPIFGFLMDSDRIGTRLLRRTVLRFLFRWMRRCESACRCRICSPRSRWIRFSSAARASAQNA